MNKEETKKAIDVMQAFVDGKQIIGRFGVATCPHWDWAGFFYKVKPEPFECWVNIYKGDNYENCCHDTEAEAIKEASDYVHRCAVHMREVEK